MNELTELVLDKKTWSKADQERWSSDFKKDIGNLVWNPEKREILCPECGKPMWDLGIEDVDWEEDKVRTYGCVNCIPKNNETAKTIWKPLHKNYFYYDNGTSGPVKKKLRTKGHIKYYSL